MNYIEVKFTNTEEQNDILLAFLSDTEYEMFDTSDNGLNAYIREENFSEEILNAIIETIPNSKTISYTFSSIPDRNWNEEWESSFEPVIISDKVVIRAPFHKQFQNCKYELIIEPKMSFGTGHHPTTTLMVEMMLELELEEKELLDMGCGSGVLAILAYKMNARKILAVDFDEWAYENTIENCERNNSTSIEVIKGNVNVIKNRKFDIILANINRNILLADTISYVNCLNKNGYILQSGFLNEDEKLLIQNAELSGLKHIKTNQKEKWSAILFQLTN